MAKKKKNEWWDWTKALLLALGIAFIVRVFILSPIVVDGPSMLPTLHDGDQMIVDKLSYRFTEADRFDIVVFHASAQKDFIKRVIAVPGEHVAMQDNVLYIDGERVEQPFLNKDDSTTAPYNTDTNDFVLEDLPGGHEVVPEGHVFVLGDNRSNSTDSRMLGVIPMDELVGKTAFIYWPFDRIQFLGEGE